MIVERFKEGRAREVYERFRAQGRLAPEGLEFIDSWVSSDVSRCYQVMRTDDPRLLERWAAKWQDLVDFEFVPVISSREAALKILGD